MPRHPPSPTLFPYTTLFRSVPPNDLSRSVAAEHGFKIYPTIAEALTLGGDRDRKSTRLNSSHRCISYAVFCLKKKINDTQRAITPCQATIFYDCDEVFVGRW